MANKLLLKYTIAITLIAISLGGLPDIFTSYEGGAPPNACYSNSLTPMPNPNYYGIGCFNSGVAREGF